MTQPASLTRSALLRSCALAVAAVALPDAAMAQAFQATPSTVQGTIVYDRATPGVETVIVQGVNAVIDWTPDEISGTALTFLPDGNTATFEGAPGETSFAVLNRILPTAVSTPTEFAGTVQALLTDGAGGQAGPGGFVAFYSPTGIIVSGTAVFDVPQLLLTTNDVDVASFTDFATGAGQMLLSGSDATVNIFPGATLTGTPEDSFFIVSSSQINMGGDAYFNGSTAYVGGLDVSLAHSSGLFDIIVNTGTAGGTAISLSGSTGGPSSTGTGDEHVIYAVTKTEIGGSPGQMLFTGNLGFDPAASASVVNGDIILAANHDVFGRNVGGDSNRQGANSFFDGRSSTSDAQTDIGIFDLVATSNLLAISTNTTQLQSFSAATYDGDVTLVGRDQAIVVVGDSGSIDVAGDLFVSARNFGAVEVSPPDINATGGFASVSASSATISVAGNTLVTADAIAGLDSSLTQIGSATAGLAEIFSEGSALIDLQGDTTVSSVARTDQAGNFDTGGVMTGGTSQLLVDTDGTLNVAGDLFMNADAETPNLTGTSADGGANATGGLIYIGTDLQGGTLQVDGDVLATANGTVGDGVLVSGSGATGTGGFISLASYAGGDVQLLGPSLDAVRLEAEGNGANITGGGDGGAGLGGFVDIYVDGGNLDVTQQIYASSVGRGGDGFNGGQGTGGSAYVTVLNSGTMQVGDSGFISALARGGAASGGTGGIGIGGFSSLLVDSATLTVGNSFSLSTLGTGGQGNGAADAGTGQGGDTSASLEGGSMSVGLALLLSATGSGGTATGTGNGGDGSGGTSLFDISVGGSLTAPDTTNGASLSASGNGGGAVDGDGGNGSGGGSQFVVSGTSTADLGRLAVSATSSGGDSDNGTGGTAQAGTALIDLSGTAAVDITGVLLFSGTAFGGDGATGNTGTGGAATLLIDGVSSLSSATASSFLNGNGGAGTAGDGGDGIGGSLTFNITGGQFSVAGVQNNDLIGTGGDSTGGTGGNGTGGSVDVQNTGGTFLSDNTTTFRAIGRGGDALSSGQLAGNGQGGFVSFSALAGSDTQLGSLGLYANAFGGGGTDAIGGAGQGGTAELILTGASSTLSTTFFVALVAFGTGGDSTAAGSTGGAGSGGTVQALLDGQSLQSGSSWIIDAAGSGGDGVDLGGAGQAGDALVAAAGGVTVSTGVFRLSADASGGGGAAGGLASGGNATLDVADAGTSLAANSLTIQSFADSFAGGDAVAGDATVAVTAGADLNVSGATLMDASATGGTQNVAGTFDFLAVDGNIVAPTVTIFAGGDDAAPSASNVLADNGTITIDSLLSVDVTGDLVFEYANGGAILGGTTPGNLTALWDISALGTIFIDGDSTADRFFAASTLQLAALDMVVSPTVNFGGLSVEITSLDTANRNIVGGATAGTGFTLTDAEVGAIMADILSIRTPVTADPDVDVEIRDLTLVGSAGGGEQGIALISDGVMQIVGQVLYAQAGASDTLDFIAGPSLRMLLPDAYVSVFDDSGALGGQVFVIAENVVFGTDAITSVILADPNDVTIPDLLNDFTLSGLSGSYNYLSANSVSIAATGYLYGQNTGDVDNLGGVEISAVDGSLTIVQIDPLPTDPPLVTILYGLASDSANDVFVYDDDFFFDRITNATLDGPFTDASTLNNCLINNVTCSIPTPTPVDPESESNIPPNRNLLEDPLEDDEKVAEEGPLPTTPGSDQQFGLEFPALFNAPMMNEDERVDDPVTSGGDSALYSLGQRQGSAGDGVEGGED